MRIVFLGLAVAHLESTGNLFTELIIEFHNQGHEIIVVAPSYDEFEPGVKKEGGILVLRVPTLDLFGKSNLYKGLANLLLPYQYKKALKESKIDLNFDLVMMPTPPITLVNLAQWLKTKYQSKIYLILRDIFPQNAVDLKIMRKNGLLHSYFRNKEKNMYRISDFIGCMSQGNIDYVLTHNQEISKNKLHLLPNWRPLQEYLTQDNEIQIREEYGLNGKFIIIFGGNIGKPQKMENIVKLAKACSDIKDIYFLIFGDGSENENLKRIVSKSRLTNFQMHDYLEDDKYNRVLQIADVGLISLSEDFTIPNIPSKALAYYNAKKPILAAIDNQTDMGPILESIGAGVWAEANNTQKLKEKLLLLYKNDNLRREMGQKGYDYLKNNLTTAKAYETIINNISK